MERDNQLTLDNSLAFLTPGQGGQAIKLGFDIAQRSKAAAAVKEIAGDYFGGRFLDIWENGPPGEEDRTKMTQRIVMTDTLMRMAALAELRPRGTESWVTENGQTRERYRCPLSSGLIPAGVGIWYTMEEAFKFMAVRSQITGDFFEGLEAKMFVVEEVPKDITVEMRTKFDVLPCLYNTDTQEVNGGPTNEVDDAVRWLAEKGYSRGHVMLPKIGGVFHHPTLAPVAKALIPHIEGMKMFQEAADGRILLSKVTGEPLTTQAEVRTELSQHNVVPDRHRDAIHYLVEQQGVDTMIALDSGRRLVTLNDEMFEGDSRKKITLDKQSEQDDPPVLVQTWRADEEAA